MKYLVVLNYTTGVTDITVNPENLEDYLEETYQECDILYMVCSSLNIEL